MQADDIPLYRLRKQQPGNNDKTEWLKSIYYGIAILTTQPLVTFITVFVASLVLTLMLGSIIGFKNWQLMQHTWDNSGKLMLYIKSDVNDDEIKTLLQNIQQRPDVEKAIYISSEQGLKELTEKTTFALAVKELAQNPLPAVIEILPASSISFAALAKLVDDFKVMVQVEKVQFDKDFVQHQYSLSDFLQSAVKIFIAIFAMVLLVLISNAMQMHAKKNSLVLMLGGVFYGLLSGLLTFCLMLMLQHSDLLLLEKFIDTDSFSNSLWAKLFAGSIIAGTLSALLAKLLNLVNLSINSEN